MGISDLTDKLQQPGHFTLFAPTNAAFSKLNSEHIQRIMADKDVLKGMLMFMITEPQYWLHPQVFGNS